MTSTLRLVRVSVGLLGAFFAMSACGSNKQQVCQGYEQCACYANMTCNAGLVCMDGICFDPLGQSGASSVGGTNPGAGGTNPGAGGTNPGAGGSGAGFGGSTGDGGSNTAGSSNTGGTDPGSGGSGAEGGTLGAGGSGTSGSNLIINGDFSQGSEYWERTWNDGEIAYESYSGGEYCIGNLSSAYYLSFSLGFPPTPSDAFAIEPGASYTMSYRARGSASVTAKIGQAVSPYAEVVSFIDTVSSSAYTTYSHIVTSSVGEPQAGLVFNSVLSYLSEVCFDDVVFVRN
jgi:hypothetical protein